MKTPKPASEKQKNLAAPAGGKITKNKGKGKNQPGNKINAAKAKLGLQKGKDTVKMQDVKNLQNKGDMKNKVFNGKGPQKEVNGGSPKPKGGKKRKSNEGAKPEVVNEKKSKKTQGAPKSPEVQLGLKIEKLLESPKSDGPGKKSKKKGKKGAAGAKETTPQTPNQADGSSAQGKKKRKRKSKNTSASSPPAGSVTPPTGKSEKKKVVQRDGLKPDHDKPIPLGNFPTRPNAENAVKALLKSLKERKAAKPALLDEFEPLLVCVDFFKHPTGRKISRILLPHHILGENADVLFISTDAKKTRRDFDEAIDTHKQLFKSCGVTQITEIIPWKKLCLEYTQFEEKRKLVNRGDAFLIDSRLSHRWPAIMRKKFFRKKAPVPVRLFKTDEVKKNVDAALRKAVVIISKENTTSASPTFGHTKMNVKSLVDNLITIVTYFCSENFPGGQPNIRQINIRSPKSESFPVFVSTASPNSVEMPQRNKKKKPVVEGEVTTAGVTVAVHPTGRIQIKSKDKDLEDERNTSPQKQKKVKDEIDSDEGESDDYDEDDDSEIDASLLEKFKKDNAASDDESSDEEEIDKAELEFLEVLRKQQEAVEAEAQAKSKKAGKKVPAAKEESSDEDDDEEDEDEDDDDEDDSDVPDLIPAKKAKPQAPQPKKGKNAKQAPGGGKPGQNGVGKGKPGKGQPKKQAQSPKGGPGKKGPQGGKGNANQKGNKKGSPKQQQRYFNKPGKK